MKNYACYATLLIMTCAQKFNLNCTPTLETCPIQILLLKEQDPLAAPFFERTIESTLKKIYAQSGCQTMSQMNKLHGDDQCLRFYQYACQEALYLYWQEKTQEQASAGNQYYNW